LNGVILIGVKTLIINDPFSDTCFNMLVVPWQSKKQSIGALSNTQAKYMAVASAKE
jgi:hypothetical protein